MTRLDSIRFGTAFRHASRAAARRGATRLVTIGQLKVAQKQTPLPAVHPSRESIETQPRTKGRGQSKAMTAEELAEFQSALYRPKEFDLTN